MRVQNPKALELFCLIGLMPGGVSEETLEVLWGSDCYLHNLLISLTDAQLVQIKHS